MMTTTQVEGSAETTAEPTPQRRHGRHRVMLAARLTSAHGVASVALLDLSQGGAMVTAPLPLPRGASVVLMRGPLAVHATIVWTEGRRLGLQFDEPISEAAVDETISTGIRVAH